MSCRLSLVFVYQHKISLPRAAARAGGARPGLLLSHNERGGGGRGKREVLDEKRSGGHWCGPE